MKKEPKKQVNFSLDPSLFQRLEDHRFKLITEHKQVISRSAFFVAIFKDFFEKVDAQKNK